MEEFFELQNVLKGEIVRAKGKLILKYTEMYGSERLDGKVFVVVFFYLFWNKEVWYISNRTNWYQGVFSLFYLADIGRKFNAIFFAIVFLANKKTSKHYSMLFSIRVKPAWNQDLMNV